MIERNVLCILLIFIYVYFFSIINELRTSAKEMVFDMKKILECL